MILFAPAKINLGLHILEKRQDGYHEIETMMAEIPLCDILEITEAEQDGFVQTGIVVPSDGQPNLCERAVQLLRNQMEFPKVQLHLRKQIPIGAGLGGGSADASFTLKGLNDLFNLGFTNEILEGFAAQLGSDCPFFIQGGLQLAKGRGEQLTKLPAQGKTVRLVLCNPGIHVSTATAYSGVIPSKERISLQAQWNQNGFQGLQNDFETSIFKEFPAIFKLKKALLDAGAIYAAMSGSGSSVFGLFELHQNIELPKEVQDSLVFNGAWHF